MNMFNGESILRTHTYFIEMQNTLIRTRDGGDGQLAQVENVY